MIVIPQRPTIALWILLVAISAGGAAGEEGLFTDIAEEIGLDFVHFNGMTGKYYFPEMTGQGGGWFDYDNDGDLDVYLVQGAMMGPGETLDDALFPLQGPAPPRDRLFRNDLRVAPDGGRRLRFVDVTDKSGIRAPGYGMGIAAGDYDNDGWIDLYVTNFGSNQLWHNDGGGADGQVTFTDVTAKTGTDDPRWSSSAAFVDIDHDGWLDLYVANYVDFSVDNNIDCYTPSSRRDYCGPAAFGPLGDRLLRNRGDGTFEDVTLKLLTAYKPRSGLGVVGADFNGDRLLDLYVANDGQPNQLWMQLADGGFRDDALLAGVAVNAEGRAEASMGVDAGDFDGDGDLDLMCAHLKGETNTLYVNDGMGFFEDRSVATGVGPGSFSRTTFGTGWFDYDNDGWLDLVTLSGAVRILEDLVRAGDLYPLDQSNQLFRNVEGKRFQEITHEAGKVFELVEVSRGAAFGDVDNDGDADVLLINNNGRARLLRNNVGNRNHWVGLRLVGTDAGRDMLGARVGVTRSDGKTIWERVHTDGSYCVTNDPRVLIGLGAATAIKEVRVEWPDGKTEQWNKVTIDTYTTLRQGTGKAVP